MATTSRPFGTVTRKVYDALSVGWSFTGNQLAATCGWPAMSNPSSVAMKPAPSSIRGTPPYTTLTVK